MGSYLSRFNLQKIINNYDKVYLMLDNDEVGRNATENIALILFQSGLRVYDVEYYGKDPGEMVSKEQIINSKMYQLADFI